jgi:hypothetical protein
MRNEPIVIRVPSSHLYRGMHLRAVCEAGARPVVPEGRQAVEVLLLFEDGSYAPADLLLDRNGRVALHVAAYTTASGTSIRAKAWTLNAIEERESGLDIQLGYHFP